MDSSGQEHSSFLRLEAEAAAARVRLRCSLVWRRGAGLSFAASPGCLAII